MAQRNDTLYELIKKLTPSEKRYFKLFVKGNSSSSDNNKYLQLFDSISRQSKYDEAALIKKFRYEKNPNSFSVAKNYLSQLILKCLRNYKSNKSLDIEIINLMQDAQSLYSRGLFEATQKVIAKASKLAHAAKRQELILMICQWERRLVEEVAEVSTYVDNYASIMEAEKKATNALKVNTSLYTQYKKLQFQNLREGFKKRSKNRDLFFQLLQHPLLDEKNPPENPTSLLYYWMCFFEYHCGMRNLKLAYEISCHLYKHFEKHPFLIEFDKESYVACLSNYLAFTMECGPIEQFVEKIEIFKKLKVGKNSHHLQRRKEIDYFNLMMTYYERTENYEQAVNVLVPKIKSYFSSHKHSSIDYEEFLLKNTAAWVFLIHGQPEEAAEWLSYLDNEIDPHAFLAYFIVCRILLLLVHYTLKNYQLVESIAKSTIRILEAKDRFMSTDAFLLKFFKKAGATDDIRAKQVKLLKQLKEDIETIYFYVDDKPPYRLQGIVAWVDGLLLNKPLAKVIRERSLKMKMEPAEEASSSWEENSQSFIVRRINNN